MHRLRAPRFKDALLSAWMKALLTADGTLTLTAVRNPALRHAKTFCKEDNATRYAPSSRAHC